VTREADHDHGDVVVIGNAKDRRRWLAGGRQGLRV